MWSVGKIMDFIFNTLVGSQLQITIACTFIVVYLKYFMMFISNYKYIDRNNCSGACINTKLLATLESGLVETGLTGLAAAALLRASVDNQLAVNLFTHVHISYTPQIQITSIPCKCTCVAYL